VTTTSPTSTPTPNPTNTPVPTATATPSASRSSYTTTASVSPSTVARGSKVSITAAVTSATTSSVLVAIEVHDSSGAKVFQKSYNNQSFAAGQTRTYTTSWNVPMSAGTGAYTVAIGVYAPGWGTRYSWNGSAACFSVI
jgi:hypothetical protein